jgi:hypothetical protein
MVGLAIDTLQSLSQQYCCCWLSADVIKAISLNYFEQSLPEVEPFAVLKKSLLDPVFCTEP